MPEGVPRALFGVPSRRSDVALLSTPYALGEAEKNLREKAPKSLDDLDTLIAQLEVCSEPPSSVVAQVEPFVSYPSDRRVLAGAVYAQADWFVTGDKNHFGHLYGKTVHGVLILSLREALSRLISPSSW
jgi:hypothetical protein